MSVQHITKHSIPGFPGYRIDQFGTIYGRKGDPIRVVNGYAVLMNAHGVRRSITVAAALREAGLTKAEPILPQEDAPRKRAAGKAAKAAAPAPQDGGASVWTDALVAQLRKDLDERTESLRLAREVNRHLISRMRSLEAQVKAAVHGRRVEPGVGRDFYEDAVPPETDDYDALPAWRNA